MGFVAYDCEEDDETQAGADTAGRKAYGDKERMACALQGCGSEGKGRKQRASKCSLRCSAFLGDSRVTLYWDARICSSNFPTKPLKRAQNALRSQKQSTSAVLGNSRPDKLLFGDTVWPLSYWGIWMLTPSPWARAQQHLGMLKG